MTISIGVPDTILLGGHIKFARIFYGRKLLIRVIFLICPKDSPKTSKFPITSAQIFHPICSNITNLPNPGWDPPPLGPPLVRYAYDNWTIKYILH